MRRDESISIRVDPMDIVEIETQFDERRRTVLYVHVNGVTVLRIQGLDKDSQLHPVNPIEMKADNHIRSEIRQSISRSMRRGGFGLDFGPEG